MENVYQEELMEHYRHPRNKGRLDFPNVEIQILNPSCGDDICIQAHISDNILQDIAFQGNGCIISQAAASIITDYCIGRSLDELEKLAKSDVLNLLKVPVGPNRLKCALLSLDALQNCIQSYKSKK